jgi:muramidase (phage lysozyme)
MAAASPVQSPPSPAGFFTPLHPGRLFKEPIMDKNVPAGAAILLAEIAEIETSRKLPGAYDVIYGHNQTKLPVPLTMMTVDEVIAAGPSWTRRFKSSAAGAYQFMNATLKGLKKELGLRGAQVFDGNLQDRLGYHLLLRRGYADFMDGRITATEFGKRLAMEWASFPVLQTTKGAHVQVARGQSYYAGDKLNKALVPPQRIDALLARVKAVADTPEPPVSKSRPDPSPPGKRAGKGNWLPILAFAAFVAAVIWFVFFVKF